MITIEWSEEEPAAINYERYNHWHPRVPRKMEAIWLTSQQLTHKDICRLTGITKPTLVTYLKDYPEGGLDKLKEIRFYRPQSELNQYPETRENYFRDNPPSSIKEGMEQIVELTGIK